jgi:L-ascorbate metabolism protein UlaG (beta-lactamase superfamily)
MKVQWLGHASFLITSDAGIKVVTDPYAVGGPLHYGEIKETADIVTVSHDHFDHNNIAAVGGNPEVVKATAEVKGIQFNGTPTYHDEAGGSQRGNNTIFSFEVDGIKVCHLGDLGHPLDDKQVADLGNVDILLTPVGGNFTIDARVATEVCSKLAAKVIIPMHYQNERCSTFPVAGVDEFLQGKTAVNRPDANEVEFRPGELPATTQIIVLQPAL